jgi:hypothetical protein
VLLDVVQPVLGECVCVSVCVCVCVCEEGDASSSLKVVYMLRSAYTKALTVLKQKQAASQCCLRERTPVTPMTAILSKALPWL